MRLALRLVADGHVDDVAVDIDGDATVGELAGRLIAGLPGGVAATISPGDGPFGLTVDVDVAVEDGRRVLAPDTPIDESPLRSGCIVTPTPARLVDPVRADAATLHLLDGPDAPATISLPAGTSLVGRGRDVDVRLSDPMVSKRHARIRVADLVEVVDEASANGIVVGERTVDRTVLRSGDRIRLGDTTISVTAHALTGLAGNEIAFNRSPRVAPDYSGVELIAPEPPQPPSGQRFPFVSLLAPILMAGMIFAVTRSTLSILFVALSPIMMVGSWLETRLANRRQLIHETAQFRSALADLATQLEYAADLERRGRRAEHPSVVAVLESVEARTPLLWTRRPEHDLFGQTRFGLGSQASRNRVELPSTNKTLPHLWRELLATVERFRSVDGVPVVADLATAGNLGVAGPERAAGPVLRGLVAQFAALHSPAELSVLAIGVAADWDWMKWLPHVAPGGLAGNHTEATSLIAHVEALLDDRLARAAADDLVLPVVLLIVHDDLAAERSRLVQIAERGGPAGVHVLWYATATERLPAACRAYVEVDAATGVGSVGLVRSGELVGDVATEPLGAAAADRFARLLSPIVDAGAAIDDVGDLPRSVAMVDLAGHEVATAGRAIIERWSPDGSLPGKRGRDHDSGLRTVVGHAVDGPIHLDLRAQGPHALVGGTTGSGKSEFLQSWILGMAMNHSPSRVTFLLVDYKGGAAFADCVELPHCVGLVTDLSPHLVSRALASLDAELRRREQLLHDRHAKDLIELERRGDPDCPPSLVVVVDEFAALVADVPEFVDGVVNIAQRGRSLGLHLVLATQRPAGVIRDNLRANTNLRIALRMADADDSLDVIGTDQAAEFDPAIPGRAIVKSGPGRVVPFQAAYIGGHSTGAVRRASIEISALRFGAGERWAPPVPEVPPGAAPHGPTDLRRIVAMVNVAHGELQLPAPRRPWLPELAERYRLEALPTERTDRALVFGVTDRPALQSQPEVAFHPDRDGNMAVFGAGGSGKSAALRTIAVAAGFAPARGGPCHVYGLDFGARGLHMLEGLPHVGSIVAGDDSERLQRLLRLLRETIDERAGRYARAQAATIAEYRRRSGHDDEPRIILLVDNVGAFRSEYEGGAATRWWDLFQSIAADGRGVGVHVVVSADRPTAISSGLASAIQRRLVLRLANDMDYALVDAPADAFDASSPAGRGFVDGHEVQVAVVGGEPGVDTQTEAIGRLADAMVRAGSIAAAPIGSLPDRVALSELAATDDPAIGLCDDSLAAIGFDPTGAFLVAGPPQSGTSTTVATLVRSLSTARPDTEFVLLGQRRTPLASVVRWAAAAHGESEIAELATRLAGRLDGVAPGRVVVVVEAIGELLNTAADLPVQELLTACRDADAFVIAQGETSSLTGSWPLLQAVKAGRSGVALQPDQLDGDTLFKTPFPRTRRAEFPAGRGLMVQGGRVRKVQVALPE